MTLREAVSASVVGKRLPDAFYVHVSGLSLLPEPLRRREEQAREFLPYRNPVNLVKFDLKRRAVSYLTYPNFETDPHPALTRSVRINIDTGEGKIRDYSRSKNPPILHRKELFVPAGYPGREKFERLTEAEEAAGLLGGNKIGLRKFWAKLLKSQGLKIQDHELVSA